jgi:catechol 2,3-dioxygenase-like lactoylglutathione lyase family enzyme
MTAQEAQAHIAGLGLLGFHHVAIIARNYDVSKAFYVDLLGFCILRETYRQDRDSYKLDLELPNGDTIELFSFPDPAAQIRKPQSCVIWHAPSQTSNVSPRRSAKPGQQWSQSESTRQLAHATPFSKTPTACRWSHMRSSLLTNHQAAALRASRSAASI